MKSQRVDLGSGVVVIEGEDACLTVSSSSFALPWNVGSPGFPGTAVEWRQALFEVRSTADDESTGERWLLAPWSGADIVRTIDRLDADRAADLLRQHHEMAKRRSVRQNLMPLLPFVGALPAAIQRRLSNEYNYPVGLATVVSAAGEALTGVILFLAVRSGLWVPPPALSWIVLLTPLFVFEGAIRFAQSVPSGQAIGSILALPALLFLPKKTTGPTPEDFRPRVVSLDETSGELELATVEPRWDWHEGEILQFRERRYRMLEKTSRGNLPLYCFLAVDEGEPTLKLAPPVRGRRSLDRGHGLIGSVVRFTLSGFAPREQQILLVEQLDMPVRSLTLISAGFELLGGIVNLRQAVDGDPLILVDLFLVADGAFRLIWSIVSRAPVGSVLGLPFGGLYRRWLGDDQMPSDGR